MGTLKTGMARYMDPQGRLVIPSEMRKQFGLQEGSLVDFQVTEDGILLQKAVPQCCVCGASDKPLHEVDGVSICHDCAEAIAAKVGSWNEGR